MAGSLKLKAVAGYLGMNAFMCVLTSKSVIWGNSSHQSVTTDSLAECSENATHRTNLEEDQLLPRCKERLMGLSNSLTKGESP